MVRVCILSLYFWPVKPEYYPDKMAEMLKKAGHEVSVITSDCYHDGHEIKKKEEIWNGIKIIRCKNWINLSEFFRVWFPKIKEDYDVIHCCGGYRHIYPFLGYTRRKNSKFIISPFYPMQERGFLQKSITWIVDNTIGKCLLRRSDYCLAETENEKKWLSSLGVKNIEIIPNPIPDDLFIPIRSDFKKKNKIKGKMIFCLANHTPIKNFEDLISAMKDVDAILVIGGRETEYTNKCKKLAQKLEIDKKIVWWGFMDYKQKKQAYSACDLFVLPSRRESLGTVFLEAMAKKKPVIGTNRGGIPGIVPDRFCLYEPGDVKKLGKKINRVLEDKKLAIKLGENGFRKAKDYSFSNVSKRYIKLIEKLAGYP